MINKTNDWIAANLNAPEGTSLLDMYASGITPDNTTINSRDYYKNIPQVQNTFTLEDGSFDEESFNSFYDSALRTFNEYDDEQFIEKTISNMNRSPYDWMNLDNPNILDTSAYLTNIKDKNRSTVGTVNIWQTGDPVYSDREVAQANYVRDEDGKILDWTANDKGGVIKNLFRPTLALATWDEDGTHFENGVEVQHFKGESKLDWKGDPYTEILGDKEGYGKDIVKWSDILTKEDSWVNKIDLFDSDGLEKSIGATIAETAIKMAPFLLPGAGPYLGYAIAAKELASVMPTFLKGMNGLFGGDNDSVFGKSMNKWESYMERYSDSMSDRGKANFWNFENIGNVISSSFGQLTSQRSIAALPRILGNTSVRSSKVGQTMALGYMALTSSKDSYKAFKEAGAADWLAGAGMLGTMGAYYGLMSIDYFKQWLFKDSWLGENVEFRRSFDEFIKQIAKEANLTATKNIKSPLLKKMLTNNVINTIYTKGGELLEKLSKTAVVEGLAHSGLNEGIEEVTEEIASDIVKALALGLEAAGFKVTEDPLQKLNFGFSAEDMLQRYAASFVGGFIGGTVFKGYEWYDNLQHGHKMIHNIDDLHKRMAWYSRNGYYDKAIQILDEKRKKQELPASVNLAAVDFAEVDNLGENKDSETKMAFLSTKDQKRSQHDYLYYLVKDELTSVHEALTEHIGQKALLSDEQLAKSVWTKIEAKAKQDGVSVDEYTKRELIDPEIEVLSQMGYFNLAVTDANNLMNLVHKSDLELKRLNAKLTQTESESEQKAIKKEISDVEKVLKEYKNEWEEIITGKRAANYVAKAYYRISNPILRLYLNKGDLDPQSEFFPETDIHHYAKLRYGINYDSLSESAKNLLMLDFGRFQEKESDTWELRLWRMMDLQYVLSRNHAKNLQSLADKMSGYTTGKTFIGEFTQDYWKDMDSVVEHFIRMADRDVFYETIKPFKNKSIDNLSDSDIQVLSTIAGKELTPENKIELYAALNSVQKQIHILENFDAYIDVTTRMRSEKLSIDQMMSNEGVQQWGEILKINPEASDADREMQLEMIREMYTKMKNDKIISPGEATLFKLIMSQNFDIAKPIIEQWIDDNFNASPADDDRIGQNDSFIRPESRFIETGDVILPTFEDFNYSEVLQVIVGKLNNLREAIVSGNFEKVQKAIDNFKEFLLNKDSYDIDGHLYENKDNIEVFDEWKESFNVDKFIERLLYPVQELIDFVQEMDPVLKVVDQLPIIEFLNNLSLDVNGKTLKIMETIIDAENTIKLADRVEDLQIGSETLRELYDARHLLDIATAIFIAARKDPDVGLSINDKINAFGESFASTDNQLIGQQLSMIRNRIQAVIDLIEQNVVSTTEEQKRIAINVYPKLIKSLVNPSVDNEDLSLFTKKLNNVLGTTGNTLYKLWIEVGGPDLNSVTGDNYKQFEQSVRKWMSKVKETVLPLLEKKYPVNADAKIDFWQNLGNVFGTEFGEGLGDMISTKLSSQTKEAMLYDSMNLFLAIIGSDSNHFYSNIKAIFEREQKKDKSYLPYFGQELNIFIAYARDTNPELFNGFNSKLTRSKDKDDPFVKGITALKNFTMCDGSSGTGKSTGYSYYLAKLRELDGRTIISTSKIKSRHEALAKTIGGKSIDVQTILKAIGEKDEIYIWDGGHVKLSKKYELPTKIPSELKSVFGDDLSKVTLFVDEITLLHAGQMKLLTEFAHNFGITIQALGDSKQPAAKFKQYTAGLENFVYTKGPTLQASLRITNKAKRRNRSITEGLLNDVLDQYAINPTWEEKNFKAVIEKIVKSRLTHGSSDLYNFMYTYDSTGLYGEMYSVNPENFVDSLLTIAKKNKQSIAIIYDDESKSKYSKWEGNSDIELVHAGSVQGGEYDYVILDCKFVDNDKLALLRKFNMLTGRSRVGTVIGYTNEFDVRKQFVDGISLFESHEDTSAKASLLDPNSEENKELRKEFINWRMDLMDDVTPSEIKESAPNPAPNPEPGSSGKSKIKRNGTIIPKDNITTEDVLKEELEKDDIEENNEEDSDKDSYYDSYDETPYYKRRQKIVNSDSRLISDGEDTFRFIFTLTNEQIVGLLGNNTFENPNKQKSNIERIKKLFQIVSGYILDVDSKDSEGNFKLEEGFKDTLKEIDPTADKLLSRDIIKNLESDNTSFYKFIPLNNGTTIIVWAFNSDSQYIVLPIAQLKKSVSGTYKKLRTIQEIGTTFVSSKGRKWTQIKDVLGDKFYFPDGIQLGVFAPTKKTEKNLIPGKVYLPLLLPHQIAKLRHIEEYFHKSKFTYSNGVPSERLSVDGEWRLKVPIPGVQKIITFQDAMEVWNKLNQLNKRRVGNEANSLKEELRPYFGKRIDDVKARPTALDVSKKTGTAPKSLTSKSNLGRLFTAVLRYFNENSEFAGKFYTELMKQKLSFKIQTKDAIWYFRKFGAGFEVTKVTLNSSERLDDLKLTPNTFDPVKMLMHLGFDESSAENMIINNDCTITPGYFFEGSPDFNVSYDYRVFAETIPNNVTLWEKIDDFLAKDTYFNHNIYLAIYSDFEGTVADEGVWKLTDVEREEEYVWDIVTALLPVYSVDGKGSDETIKSDEINDSLFTFGSTPDSEIQFSPGTEYRKEGEKYKFYIGNEQTSITVNRQWIKDNVENGPDALITTLEAFSEDKIWVRDGGGLISYGLKTNLKEALQEQGVREKTTPVIGKVVLNGEEYTVNKIENRILEFDKFKCVILKVTDSQLLLYNPNLNNGKAFYIDNRFGIRQDLKIDSLVYLGNDDEFIYFKSKSNRIYVWNVLEDSDLDPENFIEVEINTSSGTIALSSETSTINPPLEVISELKAMLEDSLTVNKEHKLILNGKDNYIVEGFLAKTPWLNQFLSEPISEQVTAVIKTIDLVNKTIELLIGNESNVFELKDDITLDSFGAVFSENVDRFIKANPLLMKLAEEIKIMRLHTNLGFDIDSLSSDINTAISEINTFLDNNKYKIGWKYEFFIDENNKVSRRIIEDKTVGIGKTLLIKFPELKFNEISDVTIINQDDRIIQDFWVTLNSEKEHYQLLNERGAEPELRKVSIEEMLEENEQKEINDGVVQDLLNTFNSYINNTSQKIEKNPLLKRTIDNASTILFQIKEKIDKNEEFKELLDSADVIIDEEYENLDMNEFINLFGQIITSLGNIDLSNKSTDSCKF